MTLPPTSVHVIVWCGDTPVVHRPLGDRCERHKRAAAPGVNVGQPAPKAASKAEPRGPSQLRGVRGVARIAPSQLRIVTIRHGSHQFFYVKSAPVNIVEKASYKANPLPENPDATSSSVTSGAPAAKPVIVYCRPPDYTARDGLHIADGAEPWCGPARRLANPCVARTSGAPSCALFHSPVPGPGHVTRYSANVPWRPRFSQLHPCR